MADDNTITRFVGFVGVPRGRAPRRGEGQSLAEAYVRSKKRGEKKPSTPGEDLVERRHKDWSVNELRWQQLLDSYEGGDTYRNAVYSPDRRGRPTRNLLRHKREYPDQAEFADIQAGYGSYAGSATDLQQYAGVGPWPGQLGADPYATADDDDYELRRARTPVPEFVREAADIHLAKIYDQEVRRVGPPELVEWWDDVDGAGTAARDWFRQEFSPHYLVLGTIDVCFDRRELPAGVVLKTASDEKLYDQDKVIASIIIPQNMVWWRSDPAGNFLECLVREFGNADDPQPGDNNEEDVNPGSRDQGDPDVREARIQKFRHWTETEVTLYKHDGEVIEPTRDHGYPFLPIRRLVLHKLLRSPMVGKGEYDYVAACQREYYNRDSELILNDILQSHPSLSGDAQWLGTEKTLSVGPGNVLPVKVSADGKTIIPWTYVSPPKDPAESIRKNMQEVEDRKDRNACLTKPAGVTGTTGGTVSQSGFSKEIDENSGQKKLGNIARDLARAERSLAEFALMCRLRRKLTPAERKAVKVIYPSRFQLKGARAILDELNIMVPIMSMEEQIAVADGEPADPSQEGGNPAQGGAAPSIKVMPKPGPRTYVSPSLIKQHWMAFSRAAHEGAPEELFARIDAELDRFLMVPGTAPDEGIADTSEYAAGHGSEEQIAEIDPLGVSAATSVSNSTPVTT